MISVLYSDTVLFFLGHCGYLLAFTVFAGRIFFQTPLGTLFLKLINKLYGFCLQCALQSCYVKLFLTVQNANCLVRGIQN